MLDPLTATFVPTPLAEVLADPAIEIVLHAGRQDVAILRREWKTTFTNVFVNPASYREFMTSGRWPEQTIFVLEIRRSAQGASIDNGGQTQGAGEGAGVQIEHRTSGVIDDDGRAEQSDHDP